MHRIKTILIVDDNIYVAEAIRSLIKISHPIAVIVHADNGAKAWEIINTPGRKPDLVVSDVEMPHMGGVQLVEKIEREHSDIHVILMSGKGEPEGHRAHAFIPKPVERAKMIETIKKVLQRQVRKH